MPQEGVAADGHAVTFHLRKDGEASWLSLSASGEGDAKAKADAINAKAVEEYRKAIEINPNHPYAHRKLGVTLLFDLKDKTGAAKEFEKYLELSPFAQDASQIRQTLKELKAGK